MMLNNSQPFVSVIMPIRNEEKFIEKSLGAVLAQDYPHDKMEVLLGDGMSNDNTRPLIKKLSDASDIAVKIVDNQKHIAASGFNAGFLESKGDIVVRVDGHCEIAPSYVSACVKHLLSGAGDVVGGPIETIGRDELSKVIALAMSSPFGVGGSAFRTVKDQTMLVDTVAFPGYKREVIENVGLLDEELACNEDDDHNYRLRSQGYKILLSSDIRSTYYSRSSFRSLWRQYFRYGLWKVRILQKYPMQMRPRQFAPLMLVLGLIITAVLALLFPWGKWLFLGLAGLYVFANLAASFITASRSKMSYMLTLPIVFATLHLSYGTGFLAGLIRFYDRWGKP